MKKAFDLTLLLGVAAMVTPASADTVIIHNHHGFFHHHHNCRIVKDVRHGPIGRRVVVHKICG